MFSFLKSHPFAVEAFFESSIVLAFAVPKKQIEHLIPECLEPDLFEDEWAFIAVAIVQTEKLRPKGFPKFLGNDFLLAGYRVFVRYKNNSGRSMRGLYILKSETDKRKMEIFGNLFTHYKYSKTNIRKTSANGKIEIKSPQSNFKIVIEKSNENVSLPANSPFADWKQARKFAGPLPFTFTYNKQKKEVLIIEGVRQNWTPKPVMVCEYKIPFLDNLSLENTVLANAFIIENVPYYWKKGRTEKWNG